MVTKAANSLSQLEKMLDLAASVWKLGSFSFENLIGFFN